MPITLSCFSGLREGTNQKSMIHHSEWSEESLLQRCTKFPIRKPFLVA